MAIKRSNLGAMFIFGSLLLFELKTNSFTTNLKTRYKIRRNSGKLKVSMQHKEDHYLHIHEAGRKDRCNFPLQAHSDGSDGLHISFLKSKKDLLSIILVSLALFLNTFSSSALAIGQYNKDGGAVPPAVYDIMQDRFQQVRAGLTGEKVNKLRVGDTLVSRLRTIDRELESLQGDLYREDAVDWDVLKVYPTIFRAYLPLFTAYTDRAFPSDSDVDVALRYALRYEVGSFFSGVKDFEEAVMTKKQKFGERAFAEMSLAYDHYIKAGDLYTEYFPDANPDIYGKISDGSFIAPGIEAPGLNDQVLVLDGPDKGRLGTLLWISTGNTLANVVIKLDQEAGFVTEEIHKEIRIYPYSLVAKTTPPSTLFEDDLLAAYLASALSSGIMYPIDTYKTRIQSGKTGIPLSSEGGFPALWKGVFYFIADANDAVYVAVYGLLKPAFLSPINPNNPTAVFSVLTLTGSIGDAIGSIFRVPSEIIYKQIQTGSAGGAVDVFRQLKSLTTSRAIRIVVLSWVAVLCRDMPFAGLQIALYDVFKSLLAFLDDAGWDIFAQRLLWGGLAGGVAAFVTTPFDLLTTSIMTTIDFEEVNGSNASFFVESSRAAGLLPSSLVGTDKLCQPPSSPNPFDGVGELFYNTTRDIILDGGGPSALFTGAIPRLLFFAPAAMIFFASYETLYELVLKIKNN